MSLRKKHKIIQKGGLLTALLARSASACTDATNWHAVKIMQHTKNKLVLLDEFDKEYKLLQRPVETVAKTAKSLQLCNTVRESSVADDRKVREYVAALYR